MKSLRLAISEIINGGVEEYADGCHGLIVADEIIALFKRRGIAIADTHPEGGDVEQAPLVSGGGAEGNRPDAGGTASTRACKASPNPNNTVSKAA